MLAHPPYTRAKRPVFGASSHRCLSLGSMREPANESRLDRPSCILPLLSGLWRRVWFLLRPQLLTRVSPLLARRASFRSTLVPFAHSHPRALRLDRSADQGDRLGWNQKSSRTTWATTALGHRAGCACPV